MHLYLYLTGKAFDLWFVGDDDLTGAHLIGPVVTTTFIVLIGCNKIQNGDILVPAYLVVMANSN